MAGNEATQPYYVFPLSLWRLTNNIHTLLTGLKAECCGYYTRTHTHTHTMLWLLISLILQAVIQVTNISVLKQVATIAS